jgi:hypothetical protein
MRAELILTTLRLRDAIAASSTEYSFGRVLANVSFLLIEKRCVSGRYEMRVPEKFLLSQSRL